jgi:hypothetical protein
MSIRMNGPPTNLALSLDRGVQTEALIEKGSEWLVAHPSVNWLSNNPPRSMKPTAPRSLEVPLTSTQNRPF